MANFKILLNRVSPLYLICGYFLLFIALTLFKIQPYNFNISSLVGIWKGFVELNPTLIDKGFIIFNDGGYDGQFFYIISKSIFTNGLESFPILDSFYLRFNRLGLSLLSGFISIFVGFSFYPMITLLLLLFMHILSFFILYKMLKKSNKYLSYFHLFSPFSLNSILLLVSDSLFVSFTIISIYYLKQIGTGFSNSPIAKDKKII